MTHALQFGGVPWLRPHLGELLREVLGALELDPRGLLRVPDVTDLKKLLERVREDGLAVVAIGAGRRETLDRIQCFMAVLEGYAEHVMDAVGATVLDDLPGLRAALGRRRHDRSGLLKLLDKLLGHGPQAAPVRAGQGVLRRRRRARGDRGPQPRLVGPRGAAHAWPS